MRDQLLATRDAAIRLVMAHVELAKAEAAQIGGRIAQVAALAAIAIVLVLLAATLLIYGASLFLGEWLLGSMGWGVVHGVELFVGVAIACVLVALDVAPARIVRPFALGVIVGILVGLVLGLHLPNRAYTALGTAIGVGIDPAVMPLVVGLVLLAIVGLVVGIVLAARMDGTTGARVGAIVGMTVLGAFLGAFTAITFHPQIAIGLAITVGYAVWIAGMIADVARTGIDAEALKLRFYPTTTIETSKETLEWLQRRMPPGIG